MVAGLLLDRNAVVVARLFAVVELVVAFRGFGLCGLFLCFARSEEHTSELQSLMRISYAVFCLKKKKKQKNKYYINTEQKFVHSRDHHTTGPSKHRGNKDT